MAGDWIKMRADLQTHPKVIRMMGALQADKLRVIGALHAVWCLFDAHSEDGILDGYNSAVLDAMIGWPGFTAAMIAIGWLQQDAQCLTAPRFDEHNGRSAKRRATETERKRLARQDMELSASAADNLRTRAEQRRAELKPATPDGVVDASAAGKPARADKADCPHQEIIALYHEVLPMCPQIRDWTPARAVQLRARWNEDEARQNLAYWRRFFEYVGNCDFLVGKSHSNGRRPFFADLEWIVKAANFTKIREGKYAND